MRKYFPCCIVFVGLALLGISVIAAANQTDAQRLLDQYRQFSAVSKPIANDIPLRIESQESGRHLRVNIYGIVNHPFPRVAAILSKPAVMCDFLILNLNVKTCVYKQEDPRVEMMIYVSGKRYAPLFLALEINPYFELQKNNNNYMRVLMASRRAVWGIKEYSVIVEATPFGKSTLVRFTSQYHAGRLNMAATMVYLKTFARSKVGFTVVSQNSQGEPQYVGGMQGIIERNAVRSYLALQAYLETASVPAEQRFEMRLRRWYELTNVYPRQLHELQWQTYLSNKRREYHNQRKLQQRVLRQASKINLPRQ